LKLNEELLQMPDDLTTSVNSSAEKLDVSGNAISHPTSPKSMQNEPLAQLCAAGAEDLRSRIERLLPYFAELRERFRTKVRRQEIFGFQTWNEYCEVVLHRCRRTVNGWLEALDEPEAPEVRVDFDASASSSEPINEGRRGDDAHMISVRVLQEEPQDRPPLYVAVTLVKTNKEDRKRHVRLPARLRQEVEIVRRGNRRVIALAGKNERYIQEVKRRLLLDFQ
jgi:hypothetical protein